MNSNELASKYIDSAKHAFRDMIVIEGQVTVDPVHVGRVTDLAKMYMEDAEYFREKRKFHVSLTSIAYCEGLLDALKMLGAVRFEWPTKKERAKRVGE
jgi:hypothetical protein